MPAMHFHLLFPSLVGLVRLQVVMEPRGVRQHQSFEDSSQQGVASRHLPHKQVSDKVLYGCNKKKHGETTAYNCENAAAIQQSMEDNEKSMVAGMK